MTASDLPVEEAERLMALQYSASEEEQLQAWKDAARRYPASTYDKLNTASMLLSSGDLKGARQLCEAVELDDDSRPKVAAQLAVIDEAEGAYADAVRRADQATEGGYDWPPAQEARAKSLRALGETDAAETAFLETYRGSPHSWSCLQSYCELTGRSFRSPLEGAPSPVTPLERTWMYHFIDDTANRPDASGEVPGCNHTLRFAERWAQLQGCDIIALYQSLNSGGGFCDCEVIYNVEETDASFDSWVILAGAVGSSQDLREALIRTGVAEVSEQAPSTSVLEEEAFENDEDADEPTAAVQIKAPNGGALGRLLSRKPTQLEVWPQRLRGRQLGALMEGVRKDLDGGSLFWVLGYAVEDESTWAWWWSAETSGSLRVEGELSEGLPEQLAGTVDEALPRLRAIAPEPAPREWTEAISLPASVTDAPRLGYFGAEYEWKIAAADGSVSGPSGLEHAFHVTPSPDGTHVAYVELGAQSRVVIAEVDSGRRVRVHKAPNYDERIEWLDDERLLVRADVPLILGLECPPRTVDLGQGVLSRDRQRIATSSGDGMSVTTLEGVEVISAPLQGIAWDFSPAGGQMAVTVNENNSWRVHIWDLESNQTRPLSPAGASCYRPAFTHDGTGLVYTHRSPDGVERIARVQLEDESFEFITEGPNDSHPAPHPTNPWLAFTRRNPGADPSEQVWTLGPDGVERAMPGRGAEPKWWD